MARNFKTSKKARTTYKVYDAYDRVVAEFIPGQDGVTEVLIQQLHAADDEEFDANRREAYHAPVHYMAYASGDAEEAEDRNSYLVDEAADPSTIFEKAISRAEFKREFHERWKHLTKEQQRLVIRKANGETNVAIAAEQGVSEAAIRKQLKRILMTKCAEVWVFGNNITKGMAAEIRRANETQKPVRYFSNKCKEVH